MANNEPLSDDFNQMIRGYMQSRIAVTGIELDVFAAIGDGAGSAETATKLGTDARATDILLNALTSMELLTKKDGVFHNTALGDKFLRSDAPESRRAALMHQVGLWNRWAKLTDVVRTGIPAKENLDTEKKQVERAEIFMAAMHHHASPTVDSTIDTIGFTGVKRAIDVGGGPGDYAVAFARKSPDIRVTLLDRTHVIPISKKYVGESEVADRVEYIGGDMLEVPLGENYDLVFLGAICHMWSPEQNLLLFKKCFDALAGGGRIAIKDFILSDDKVSPQWAAVFAVNMLVGTDGGNSYSAREYADWLAETGFKETRVVETPGQSDLVVASKP
jgi:ubiquinone/menaquinone biosynthesis C-methylase UbiE